jgi:hypothetical protein
MSRTHSHDLMSPTPRTTGMPYIINLPLSTHPHWPEAPPGSQVSEEDQATVFGRTPTVEALLDRWIERGFNNVVVLCGAGISVSAGE